jgi:hypothetical protein
MWRNGRMLQVYMRSSWLDLETTSKKSSNATTDRGLIGIASSTTAGELVGRPNQRGNDSDEKQVAAFVSSWRIASNESLFDYLPTESYATFDLRDFPYQPALPSKDELSAAGTICTEAGVVAARLAACAFDIAVTGSKDFLESYRSTRSRGSKAPTRKPAEKMPTPDIYPATLTPTIATPVQTLPNGEPFIIRIGSSEQRTYHIDGNRTDPPVFLTVKRTI